MTHILLSIFFFIASVIGLAISLMILFSKKDYSRSYFLGLFLFSLASVSIYNFYLVSKVFKDFPDLFIITKSFIFLVAPCAFLYVHDIIFPISGIKKYYSLHFIPFLIYFVFTVVSYAGKFIEIQFLDFIDLKMKNFFSIVSVSLWLIYSLCPTIMLLNFNLYRSMANHLHGQNVLKWIRIFNLLVLFLFSALFVYFFLVNKLLIIDYACRVLFSGVLFFIALFIYFRPYVFKNTFTGETMQKNKNNMGQIVKSVAGDVEKKNCIKEIHPEKRQLYLIEIEKVFKEKKIFLRKNLIIRDIEDETGIKAKHISYLVNSEFNVHFQDYVNLLRIQYFKEKLESNEWKDLSLEGMSWESGFKSRSTCFRAFVKHTGCSPSEFLKNWREEFQITEKSLTYK